MGEIFTPYWQNGFNTLFKRGRFFDSLSFLNWMKKNSYPIPKELAFHEKNGVLSWAGEGIQPIKNATKLKPEVQAIGKDTWCKYPVLDIKRMVLHPQIQKICHDKKYTFVEDCTIHEWLAEVAPDDIKKGGRRTKENLTEQERICKSLGIPFGII